MALLSEKMEHRWARWLEQDDHHLATAMNRHHKQGQLLIYECTAIMDKRGMETTIGKSEISTLIITIDICPIEPLICDRSANQV